LDEIAEASEFGKATLYNYFKNKEELFVDAVNYVSEVYHEKFLTIYNESKDAVSFITNLTQEIFDYSLSHKHEYFFLAQIRMNFIYDPRFNFNYLAELDEKVNSLFLKKMNQGVKIGELKKLNTRTLLGLYRSMVHPYIYHMLKTDRIPQGSSLKNEIDTILDVFFNGILSNENKESA